MAVEEAEACAHQLGSRRLLATLHAVASKVWEAPLDGVGLDAVDAVAAVVHCTTTVPGLREAMVAAVELGGDTDTVAALVGGLLACRMSPADVAAALPWLGSVRLAPRDRLDALAHGLADVRAGVAR